ncbi:hypothetical protein HDU89_008631 [Geranomyces variabilis]|nr:hypothetical protein HDU89_008631 [Geranomyces variabilis]
MIDLARRNASKSDLANVEFRLGEIEHTPLPDNTADCVISNCVINLCPDKSQALREIHRILKPGGRLAISDIVLKQPLPEGIKEDVYAYVGCVAGAIQKDEYVSLVNTAGFKDAVILDAHADLNAYAEMGYSCCDASTSNEESAESEKDKLQQSGPCCAPTCCNDESKSERKERSCCTASCCDNKGMVGAANEGTTRRTGNTPADWLKGMNVNDYAASVKIFATKPSA